MNNKRGRKNTGIESSIIYDLVKKHNGEIEVESDTGKETSFTVKMPITEGK